MYKISLGVMAVFYVVAGINHFLHPEMYVSIMPGFLPESPGGTNFKPDPARFESLGELLAFNCRKFSCFWKSL